MKIIDNWRFEYIKDHSSSWNLLKVGGYIREEGKTSKDATTFTATVTDLQGFNELPQFEEGFILQTESGQVALGTKEQWDEAR